MRILIVEDEPLIAMLLQDWLVELGCSPLGPAATVASALALIKEELPDAAILDLSLRGEKSDPVAEELASRGIPVVIASGSLPAETASGMMLAKPYDFNSVRALVDALKAKFDRS